MKCRKSDKNLLFIILLIFMIMESCVTSHVFEDAQLVGKGNMAVESTLARAIYTPVATVGNNVSRFYADRDIGTARVNLTYGVANKTDIGIGLDIPVGLRLFAKHNFKVGNIRHLHAIKVDGNIPIISYFSSSTEKPLFSLSPSYIYTYRHDDLLSFSLNGNFINTLTNERLFHLPGISGGIHLGNEIRFTAGVSYFNNFGYLGTEKLQYLSVEAGIKFDL